MNDRLRLAVPNKGRLVEPTLGLLRDAGLVFEEHDRTLVVRVQNFALDILFVRTTDIIEFVGDGVADLGVTGQDLLAEMGAELPVLRLLGYGTCRLAAAVPADSAYQSVDELAGVRVATAHPETTRRFFADRRIPVDVVPLSGAVEVAPRLGLAEAIVDLVSTGSTLAAPPWNAASIAASERRPPAISHFATDPPRSTMARMMVDCSGLPLRAPSRSTIWIHETPAATNRSATPIGSSAYVVSAAKSPCRSRTTRPPRRSIAASISNPMRLTPLVTAC